MSHGIFYRVLLKSDLISEPASESSLDTSDMPSSSIFWSPEVVVLAEVVEVVVVDVVVVDVVVLGVLLFVPQAAKNNEIAMVDMIIGIYIFFTFYHSFLSFFPYECV